MELSDWLSNAYHIPQSQGYVTLWWRNLFRVKSTFFTFSNQMAEAGVRHNVKGLWDTRLSNNNVDGYESAT